MCGTGFRINGFRRWWRSVWVSVAGAGGFPGGRGYALRVLLACHTVFTARCGHLRISGGEAFSLLRFFVAVGQRNEVPPRTVANSDKEIS